MQFRNSAVKQGLQRGRAIGDIAGMVQGAMRSGIAEARGNSRDVGVKRLNGELASMGLRAPELRPNINEAVRDQIRGQIYSRNYAQTWLTNARGKTTEQAARAANRVTEHGTNRSVALIAASESSEAFNSGRTAAAAQAVAAEPTELRRSGGGRIVRPEPLGLLKVWDATLDKRTCPFCERADGTIVGLRERFPLGEPGAVHPRCRCGFSVLTSSEDSSGTLIERSPVQPVSSTYSFGPALRPAAKARAVNVPGLIQQPAFEAKGWAGRLDSAFTAQKADGGAAVRSELRNLLGADGLVSKDLQRVGGQRMVVLPNRVGGYHDWDGSLGTDRITAVRAQRAAKKIARGEALAVDELDGLQTLIHEEIHGTSLITQSGYSGGLGLSLEEASTELLARSYTRQLTGKQIESVYLGEIRGLVASVRSATKVDADAAVGRIVEAAKALRRGTKTLATAEQHADEFAAAIKATKPQRAKLLKTLKGQEWWKPEVADALEAQAVKAPTKRAAKAAAAPKVTRPKAAPKPRVSAEAKAKAAAEKKAAAQAAKAEKARRAAEAKAAKAAQKARLAEEKAENKAADKLFKAELKQAGIQSSGGISETFRAFFGRVPTSQELREFLAVDALGGLGKLHGDVSFHPLIGIEYRASTINGQVSIGRRWTKSFSDGKVNANHGSLFLSKNAQGKGLGRAVIQSQVSAYEKLGVDTISLNAAEVGRYYWPKLGFNDPVTFERAQANFAGWLKQNGVRGADKIATQTKSMRDIATAQVRDRKIGKEFLLSNANGGGHMDLNLKDPIALATLKRELAR